MSDLDVSDPDLDQHMDENGYLRPTPYEFYSAKVLLRQVRSLSNNSAKLEELHKWEDRIVVDLSLPDSEEYQLEEDGNVRQETSNGEDWKPVLESRHAQLRRTLEVIRHGIRVYERRMKNEKPSAGAAHKIRWMGAQNQLVWLFKELEKSGFLHEETIKNWAVTVKDCFVDKDGKPFRDRQMRTVKSDPTQQVKGDKAKVITDLVNRIPKKSS